MRATILQILGATSVTTGLGIYNLSLGLIAAGSFLIIFGVADERGQYCSDVYSTLKNLEVSRSSLSGARAMFTLLPPKLAL